MPDCLYHVLRHLFLIPLLCSGMVIAADKAVEVHLFWSLQCPHCLEARPQILSLAAERPWIVLHEHELSRSPENIQRFISMAESIGEMAQAVPTLIYCGQMDVGWDNSPAAVNGLLDRLRACQQQNVPPAAGDRKNIVNLPGLGVIDVSLWSLPMLTVVLASLDAFNPCAFFVLLFLLSLLVHQQDRRRMLLIGGVFVAISGLMYFAFMAAWLNLFRWLGSLPWVTSAAGALGLLISLANIKDFIAFRRGISLSIPDERKRDIFQRGRQILQAGSLPAMLLATVTLAVLANLYELLCTAGLPMVFTRLLTLQASALPTQYFYLALYNSIYVLPLALIVLAFVRTLGARRLSEREGRLLKLMSGLMMGGLSLLLLFAPTQLNNPLVALLVPTLAVLLTALAARKTRPA